MSRFDIRRLPIVAAMAGIFLLLSVLHIWADYEPGELLVRFKPQASQVAVSQLHAQNRASIIREIRELRVHRLKLPHDAAVEAVASAYSRHPLVEYAGPNHVIRLTLTPNDEHYWWQWGLPIIGAEQAWSVTTGDDTVIAVIDTGVWANHEDFYRPAPNTKVLTGYNAINGSSNTHDTNGHGTFVAGIAAAIGNNSIGGAGVAWNARILPIKIIEGNEGLESDAADGIVWAVNYGAKILNMSFGTDIHVPVLEQAINYAWNNGCISVASSGNDNLNTMNHYPSAYDKAFAVGATDEYDQRCTPTWLEPWGSNYGPWLDVMAPGRSILSAYIEDDWIFGLGYHTIGSGTSAASPFVSGAAALIWSQRPQWTNQQVIQHIIATCDDIGSAGWDIQTGHGRINVGTALQMMPEEPGTITGAKSLPNGTRVTLAGKVVTSSPGLIANRIYVSEENRSSGILVYGAVNPPAMSIGSRVDVTGTLSEINGERALINPVFSNVTAGTPLVPMAIPGRDVGGSAFGPYQAGVDDGRGLNNLGLLIRCFGVVRARDFSYLYIDDGSKLDDGSSNPGLRVAWGSTKPALGAYVMITGISGCEIPADTSLRVRTLRVRQASDIVTLQAP